ncbi:MAG: polymerase sigma-70 factor, subfamily [Nocardioidaceae bacterium]|nr:polymerase sigma-70 factor, subfamily [Nocardioidaceae bacterium]
MAESVVPGRKWPAPDRLRSLMERVSTGDRDAFDELYFSTSPLVFGIVLRILRSHAHAEEVSQEVYLEVWRTAVRFDADRGTTSAWLNVIAHRRAVDCVRSAERATRREERFGTTQGDVQDADTSDLVVAREEAAWLRRALSELPDGQRRALLLAYFDGRSYREVAEILDVPLGTVKTRIRDAMRRLRDRFELESWQDGREG